MTLDDSGHAYPPLPVSGTWEDILIADRNFAQRERVSKSWFARLLANKQRQNVTPLKRRKKFSRRSLRHKDKAASRNEKNSQNVQKISADVVEEGATATLTAPRAISKTIGSFFKFALSLHNRTSVQRAKHSLDAGLITLSNVHSEDVSRKQHIYRWANIYENQRGFFLFSRPLYSSQILFRWDPPPLSVADPFLPTNGSMRMNCKRHQPDISTVNYPFPDGNWRWVNREWTIDKQGTTVEREGWEYNWFFRSKNWKSRPGWFSAGAWVRRRKWKRLMERPALGASQRGESETCVCMDGVEDIDLKDDFENVWKGNEWDWPRAYDVMRRVETDAKRLAIWKKWLDKPGAVSVMADAIRTNIQDILYQIAYQEARTGLLELFLQTNILSESDLQHEHLIGHAQLFPSLISLCTATQTSR